MFDLEWKSEDYPCIVSVENTTALYMSQACTTRIFCGKIEDCEMRKKLE